MLNEYPVILTSHLIIKEFITQQKDNHFIKNPDLLILRDGEESQMFLKHNKPTRAVLALFRHFLQFCGRNCPKKL